MIAFAPTRKAAELVYGHVRRRLEDRGRRGEAERVQPYRAGYTPEQRRDIERRLFDARARRRRRHAGARARHRRRQPRRRARHRLPRHDHQPAPALGQGRPVRARLRRAGRRPGRARPVLHARAGPPPGAQRRGGDHRPAQPAHQRPAPRGGRLRARRSPPADEQYFGEQGLLQAERLAQGGRLRRRKDGLVWSHPYSPPRRSACAPRATSSSPSSRAVRARSSAPSSASACSASATPAPCTSTWGAATWCSTSTSRRAPS